MPYNVISQARLLMPGVLVAALIALASQFISEHYGAPTMLMALLFGIALNFLSDDARCSPGIAFGARSLLRLGVALLGLRISFEMVGALGMPVIALVVGAVLATLGFGIAVARFFGFRNSFAVLSAGSVAICGASAAMAIAAVLPRDDRSEDRLVFTVVGVTVLSTIAMILYPILSDLLGFDDVTAGIYIGATIHDVAQVVGAGFSISDEAGKTATLVKLLRVAMLAPIVVLITVIIRKKMHASHDGKRPPLVPMFVVGFVALTALNSLVALPAVIIDGAQATSSWLLVLAIAAVGLKTRPADIVKVGKAAAGLLLAETLFLAVLVALVLTFVL